ncbi:MAG: DNA polymerase III subunit delta' [Acidobacteriota bacterium]|nr:MAG: DNA polymerase III subunit delta' [Acidobacteriota bacterium]
MTFESLIGNRALVARLARMAAADTVPPSLLFAGPAGVGKLEAALTLAQAQNCLTLTGDACGECSACVRIKRGEHPDVRIARPEGAGRQLKAESVRQIVSESPFRPFEGRRRVSVFVDAERMNPTAANTLLKTLEEPPTWVVLILVTSNPATLLPTILSRCQIYRFAPLAIDDRITQLVTRHEMDRERATLLAALSGGSLPQALELEEDSLVDVRNEALRVASVVVDGAREQDMVPWADRLAKDDRLMVLLHLVIGIVRDVATTLGGGTIVHRDLGSEIEKLASGAPLPAWLRAFHLAEQSLRDLRDRYLNKRITVSRLLIELANPSR